MAYVWVPDTFVVLTNAGLTATLTSDPNGHGSAKGSATFGATDKVFWQVTLDNDSQTRFGGCNASYNLASGSAGSDANSFGYYSATGGCTANGVSIGTATPAVNGDVLYFAVDRVNNRAWVKVNSGNWNANGSADPATNVGGLDISAVTGALSPLVEFSNNTAAATAKFAAPFGISIPSGFTAYDPPPIILSTTGADGWWSVRIQPEGWWDPVIGGPASRLPWWDANLIAPLAATFPIQFDMVGLIDFLSRQDIDAVNPQANTGDLVRDWMVRSSATGDLAVTATTPSASGAGAAADGVTPVAFTSAQDNDVVVPQANTGDIVAATTRPAENLTGISTEPYTLGAVNFDGATAIRLAAMTAADGSKATVSFWCRTPTTESFAYLWEIDPEGDYANYGLTPDETPAKSETGFFNAATTVGARIRASVLPMGPWHHVLVTADLSGASAGKVFVDGVDRTDASSSFIGSGGTINFNGRSFWIGGDPYATYWHGDVADFIFAPNVSLLSGGTIPAATVARFIDASGRPVDPGVDGSAAIGSVPEIFLHVPAGAAASEFLRNRGGGSSPAYVVGSLTGVADPPSAAGRSPLDFGAGLSADGLAPVALGLTINGSATQPIEWSGVLVIQIDTVLPLEFKTAITRDQAAPVALGGSLSIDGAGPLAFGLGVNRDAANPQATTGDVAQTMTGPTAFGAGVSADGVNPQASTGDQASASTGPVAWGQGLQIDARSPLDFTAGITGAQGGPLDFLLSINGDQAHPMAFGEGVSGSSVQPIDWLGQLVIQIDAVIPLAITADVSSAGVFGSAYTGDVSRSSAAPLDALLGIAADRPSPLATIGTAAADGVSPVATTGDIAVTRPTPQDSLAGAAGQSVEPVAFGGGQASTNVNPQANTGDVAASGSSPFAAGLGVSASARSPTSWLQLVVAAVTIPVDWFATFTRRAMVGLIRFLR